MEETLGPHKKQYKWLWKQWIKSGKEYGFNWWLVLYVGRLRDMIRLLVDEDSEEIRKLAQQYLDE